MRRLTLFEWEDSEPVTLSVEERDLLATLAPGNAIRSASGTEASYVLRPDSHVGAVQLPNVSIAIRPKRSVGLEDVFFMLSYAVDRAAFGQEFFTFHEDDSLLEAIIPGFVAHVRRAFARGLVQEYRTEEDVLPVVRGRLRLEDQVRRRFGRAPLIEVRFDEFTEDVEPNRLIRAALARLSRMRVRSATVRRSVNAFDAALERVRLVDYDTRALPEILYTRLNEHYRPAVELAKLILHGHAYELRHGDVAGSSFLVDMNAVFESFVVVALRERLGLTEQSFPQNARGRSLRLAKGVAIEPDLSWWAGSRCVFVGDVKYKRTTVKGILHPDLYQLLAYTVAANLPAGLLVYAAGEGDPATHVVDHAGKTLHVVALRLGDRDAIDEQIDALAERVRAMRTTLATVPAY